MAELPFMPIATDSFIADTNHMSAAELGAFLRIIIGLWRHGGELPADEKQLARIAGVTNSIWRKMSPVVTASMQRCDGKIFDPHTLDKLADARARSAQNRANAEARWHKNRGKHLNFRGLADANALRSDLRLHSNQNQNQNNKQNDNHHHHHHEQGDAAVANEVRKVAEPSAAMTALPTLKQIPQAVVLRDDGKHALRIASDLEQRKVRNAMRNEGRA